MECSIYDWVTKDLDLYLPSRFSLYLSFLAYIINKAGCQVGEAREARNW